MSSKKTDTEGVIYGVIGFGYIISAIVFTIWVMDFERIHPKLIFWGHLVFIGVPTFVVGWIAESFEKNETQIENEIGNLIDFQGKIGRAAFWIPFLWINLITEISLLSIDVSFASVRTVRVCTLQLRFVGRLYPLFVFLL